MNELVYLKNDEPVCSSLQVAEKFEKRHANVMRAIDSLVKNDSTQNCVQCFKETTYKDSTGKSNKMYVIQMKKRRCDDMKDLKLQLIQRGAPSVYACEGGAKQRSSFSLTYQNEMR